MKKHIKAFAPATVANVICGFDILSLAIEGIGDYVELTENGTSDLRIVSMENADGLPYEIDKNVCSVVISTMQKCINRKEGYDIKIVKGFKAGSGLGSSAASAVAAAIAYNGILDEPFSDIELIEFARAGEVAACGHPIADNVSASLLGGLVMINELSPLKLTRLPILKEMYIYALFPQIRIKTSEARDILPKKITVPTSVNQSMALASFITSLYTEDLELMASSLQDFIAEPYRLELIPFYREMKQAALNNGALGFGISGSGPTVFCIIKGKDKLQKVKESVRKAFSPSEIEFMDYTSILGAKGAYIIDSK